MTVMFPVLEVCSFLWLWKLYIGLWIDSSVTLLRCIAAPTTLCSVDSHGQAFQNLLQQLSH